MFGTYIARGRSSRWQEPNEIETVNRSSEVYQPQRDAPRQPLFLHLKGR
jgi:hypothetical protein